jgi:glycosyltransferase involved in cell wall biosynthesis
VPACETHAVIYAVAMPDLAPDDIELTVVMPCLNERLTLAACIEQAQQMLASSGIRGEIVIGDNGSTDGSQDIARSKGARVIDIPRRGYGAALLGAIEAARGRYIIMGDSDMSYDFGDAPKFVERLRAGKELVMGNRFRGGVAPGAMPALHKYLGNPVLTKIGQLFFNAWEIGDFHCGLRAFTKEAIGRLQLACTGMEFASEMVVKAKLHNLKIDEVPTTLKPDGRDRPPHLRTWRDGWRHLRFLLCYSPRWTFLYPGLICGLIGFLLMLWVLPGPRLVGSVSFDVHTLVYGGGLVLVGAQGVFFAVLSKIYAITQGLQPKPPEATRLFQRVELEHGMVAGLMLVVLGIVGSVVAVAGWVKTGLGPYDTGVAMRIVVPSVVALALGAQVIFSSLFLSLLGMPTSPRSA